MIYLLFTWWRTERDSLYWKFCHHTVTVNTLGQALSLVAGHVDKTSVCQWAARGFAVCLQGNISRGMINNRYSVSKL